MHIGMKVAIPKNLIEKAGCRGFGYFGDIMPCCLQGLYIINANPLNPFNHQHMAIRALKVDMRNTNAFIIGHIFLQTRSCRCFHS